MFSPIKYQNQIMGYSAQIGECRIVYGTRYLTRSYLRVLFPDYQFCFVEQIHGKEVVPARPQPPLTPADAHWTDQKYRALVVQTADCLPVFLWSGTVVCAVHAGWRGVEQNIIQNAVQHFPSHLRSQLALSIGPHIDSDHFEVDEDVARKLSQSSQNASQFVRSTQKGKYQVSLMNIVQDQLSSCAVIQQSYIFNKSTFLTEIFYSYRRTAEKNIGQSSFVVRC